MRAQQWIADLRALGFDAGLMIANTVAFPFTIPVGSFIGTNVRIAVAVPEDVLTPPTGICVTPRLLPIHPDQSIPHPRGGVHEAPHLGPEWQYLSRPFTGWLQSTRDAAAYLAHIRHLFATA